MCKWQGWLLSPGCRLLRWVAHTSTETEAGTEGSSSAPQTCRTNNAGHTQLEKQKRRRTPTETGSNTRVSVEYTDACRSAIKVTIITYFLKYFYSIWAQSPWYEKQQQQHIHINPRILKFYFLFRPPVSVVNEGRPTVSVCICVCVCVCVCAWCGCTRTRVHACVCVYLPALQLFVSVSMCVCSHCVHMLEIYICNCVHLLLVISVTVCVCRWVFLGLRQKKLFWMSSSSSFWFHFIVCLVWFACA